MKLKLPITLLTAVLSASCYAIAAPGSGTISVGDGTYSYSTDANGTVNSTFTGDGTTGSFGGGYGYKSKASSTPTKGHIGGVAPGYKATESSNERVATHTNLTIGGVDEQGNAITTKINRVAGAGVRGYVATGNKTVTVKEGASVGLLIAGYDIGQAYGTTLTVPGAQRYNTLTNGEFAPKSASNAEINIKVEGGNVDSIYGSYLHSTLLTNEMTAAKNALSGQALADYLANPAWAQNEKINITLSGGTTGMVLGGGFNGAANNTISIEVSGKDTVVDFIYAGASSNGNGGYMGYVKDTDVKIKDGTITGSVYGGGYNANSYVDGNTSVIITGGTIANNVYGAGDGDTVKGSTYVEINGGTVEGNVYGGGKNGSVVEKDATVKLLSGDVKGTIQANGLGEESQVKGNKTLIVGSEEKAYIGTVGNIEGFDEIHVSTGSALNLTEGNAFTITEQNITLSESNLTQAAITTSTANVEAPLTLTLGFEGTLRSGKYMIISTEKPVEGWTPENVTVNGIAGFNDLKWEGNILSFVFQGGDADAMTTANWGVFKSTQAFTNVLWAPRAADSCLALPGQKDTMAWGSIYSHNSRIGSNGADYSIYGGAIGVEKGLKANRFIGAALGYDWGKVKPFSTTAVTQESFHLAGYGRAWHWCPNSTDAVSINWSAAYGRTTSEHSSVPGDWTQDNLQLDARATYYRALNNRTTVNGFAGAQYYAQDSDTTGAYKAKAMQNLRFMLGGGISYELTEKTTLYGEVALHQDVDRHNPSVSANGARFHCTNPGKFGCTVTGGAEYRINDSWSLRANYDFSTADDQTEHNINVGASYKF